MNFVWRKKEREYELALMTEAAKFMDGEKTKYKILIRPSNF